MAYWFKFLTYYWREARESQKTTLWSQFSPPTFTWMKLRSQGLQGQAPLPAEPSHQPLSSN